jgi:hypothetical protein
MSAARAPLQPRLEHAVGSAATGGEFLGAGLVERIGAGAVTVIGHSLGSALATYLTYDLAKALKEKVSACLFASPRSGNKTWVEEPPGNNRIDLDKPDR